MTNILTAAEAALVLRCEDDDARMVALLPQIDQHIMTGTGHAWQEDDPIHETAKAAARMLLVQWYEDPGMLIGSQAMGFGLQACMTQLSALALRYREFRGRAGAGPILLSGARIGDKVKTLTGIAGVSGDRSADFEAVITVDEQIQQTATLDLSGNWYRAHLTPVEDQ